MYPRIRWKLFADYLVSANYTLCNHWSRESHRHYKFVLWAISWKADWLSRLLQRLHTDTTVQGSNPSSGNRLYLLQKIPNQLWGPHCCLTKENRRSLATKKWPGCAGDHSHPFKAEVKNEWSYASTPPIRLHVADTDNFAFFMFCPTESPER